MRDYIRSILAEYYNVLEASQGEEALTVLQSQNVDFIVSDLMIDVYKRQQYAVPPMEIYI